MWPGMLQSSQVLLDIYFCTARHFGVTFLMSEEDFVCDRVGFIYVHVIMFRVRLKINSTLIPSTQLFDTFQSCLENISTEL